MCNTIRTKDGTEIETVTQFIDWFNVTDIEKYLEKYYNKINLDACLCQIDLEKFFKENPQHEFYKDGCAWHNK